MKKLLALVLALVMTMSLVTISNAADFTDVDNKIDNLEAVLIMKGVGVLDGYTDVNQRKNFSKKRGSPVIRQSFPAFRVAFSIALIPPFRRCRRRVHTRAAGTAPRSVDLHGASCVQGGIMPYGAHKYLRQHWGTDLTGKLRD